MRIDTSFVKSGIENTPFKEWESYEDSIGPLEGVPPLRKRLSGLTMCGEITLGAGILLWASKRVENQTHAIDLGHVAEASFAYQHDWRYMPRDQYERIFGPNFPTDESFYFGVRQQMRRMTMAQSYWNNYSGPTHDLFHLAWVMNLVLPKADRPDFETWLFDTHARLLGVAASPDEPEIDFEEFTNRVAYLEWVVPFRGDPLPPALLSQPVGGGAVTAEAKAFLSKLDPSKNPYLASPEKIKEEGFEGEPYT